MRREDWGDEEVQQRRSETTNQDLSKGRDKGKGGGQEEHGPPARSKGEKRREIRNRRQRTRSGRARVEPAGRELEDMAGPQVVLPVPTSENPNVPFN